MGEMKRIRGYGGGKSGGEQRAPIESPDNLLSTALARVIDLISEGEIYGFADQANPLSCYYLNETPIANADGSLNFKDVQVDSRTGTQMQDYLRGFKGVENEIAVAVELSYATPWTRSVTNLSLSAVRIRLSTPAMSSADTSTGDIKGTYVSYKIELSTDGGAYVQKLASVMSGKTTSKYQRAHRVDLPTATTGWTIRVTRLTPDSASSVLQNQTFVESFTEIIDAKYRMPMSATVGTIINAEQFNNIPTRAFRMKGRIIQVPSNYDPVTRTYEGVWNGTFQSAYSNNPAWVFYDMVTNDRYGLGHLVTPAMVDKWELYTIAKYCDEMVDDGFGGEEPRFTCNTYLQSQQDALRVLQNLASVFRGIMYVAAGSIVAVGDMPADADYLYTPANVLEGKFAYTGSSIKQRHTVALVSWNDMNNMCRAKIEYVDDPEGIARYGIRQTEVIAVGCTSRGQARRLGKYVLATERYETDGVSFGVGLDGNIPAPGSIIKIADPLRAGKRMGGRIRSATLSSITVDQLPPDTVIERIRVITPDGAAIVRNVAGVVGNVISVTAPFSGSVPVTLSAEDKGHLISLSSDKYTATRSASTGYESVRATSSESSGKWFYETVFNHDTLGNVACGIANSAHDLADYVGSSPNSIGMQDNGNVYANSVLVASLATVTAGDTVGTAYDLDNNAIWFRVNGGYWNNNPAADPETNVGGIAIPTALTTGNVFPCMSLDTSADSITASFGPTFAYAAPDGFTAVDPAVVPVPQSVWIAESEELEAQTYRVISVMENNDTDRVTFSVSALQHVAGKYEFVENNIKIEEPDTSDLAGTPDAPEITLSTFVRYGHGVAFNVVNADWPDLENATSYEIQWQKDDGAWSGSRRKGESNDEWEGAFEGVYRCRAWGINPFGIPGPAAISDPITVGTAQMPIRDLVIDDGALIIDCRFTQFRLNLDQDVSAVEFINVAPQDTILIEVTQAAPGSHTLSFGPAAGVVPVSGIPYVPTPDVGAVDLLGLTTQNSGVTWSLVAQQPDGSGAGGVMAISLVPNPASDSVHTDGITPEAPSVQVTATVTGGSAPFTHAWTRADTAGGTNFLISSASSDEPIFSIASGTTAYGPVTQTWRNLVTDALGFTAQKWVRVTLERTADPAGSFDNSWSGATSSVTGIGTVGPTGGMTELRFYRNGTWSTWRAKIQNGTTLAGTTGAGGDWALDPTTIVGDEYEIKFTPAAGSGTVVNGASAFQPLSALRYIRLTYTTTAAGSSTASRAVTVTIRKISDPTVTVTHTMYLEVNAENG